MVVDKAVGFVGVALVVLLMSSAARAQPAPNYRVERTPVAGGADLLTIIRSQEGTDDVPLVSVLRDTLGDDVPENDRLRYVWILTSSRPSAAQRLVSALPFTYFRFRKNRHSNEPPKPVLDLASPAKGVWKNLLGNGAQVLWLDPLGAVIRSSTRSYRGNAGDGRRFQTFQTLSAMEGLMREQEGQPFIEEPDLRQLYSRLSLSSRMLGGLVREESLTRFYDKQTLRIEQTRDHNWELLRQRAEMCGLYFDPIPTPDGEVREVLLWIARDDLAERRGHKFNGQFLTIANPWTDDRLINWTGYSQARYLDSENHFVAEATPGGKRLDMIPLALYSLEYPRVPLVLVDFRDGLKPKRRELASHGTAMIMSGILGVSRFSSLWVFAAGSVLNFVRAKHGAPIDSEARLEAYAKAHESLIVNSRLDPALKIELLRRLEHLAVNPVENAAPDQAVGARKQYQALLRSAVSPNGLQATLNRDRQKEAADENRSTAQRILVAAGRLFTRGPRVHAELDLALRAQVDSRRRIDYHIRFLSEVLASSPRPEVIWNTDEIRKSVEALGGEVQAGPRASRVIAQVLERTEDARLYVACLRALGNSSSEQAKSILKRIAEAPDTSDSIRTLCRFYLDGGDGEPIAILPGAL